MDLYLALDDDDDVPYYYMVNIKFGQVFWFDRKPNIWIQVGDSVGRLSGIFTSWWTII